MKSPDAPPLGADENVYLPSGREYERTPQVVAGVRAGTDFDWVTVTYRDVAEAAQIYADFSGLEVRVPRRIADRAMKFGGPPSGSAPGNKTYGHVIWDLDWQLAQEGVEIVELSRNTIALREVAAGKTPKVPRAATEAEIIRYKNSMSDHEFWTLLEQANRLGKGDCRRTARSLARSLSRLTEEELLGFELRFQSKMMESYRHDLWAVAYLANGGASEDGFTYFRAWLIAQGRERFEAALEHPPAAIEGLSKRSVEQVFECEELLYPATMIYRERTGRPPPVGLVQLPLEPAGAAWKEEDLARLYPDLYARFR
ncbi:hypothetical protein ASA1KI_02610 [Opitutales bacterium ASA1]|uniref:DUF4240 domain-containing protein n=1 Tax=Congregicoccus parvus TaxID=3081749 RepID=UPI002B325DBB|nr:hypothetical protein ASA1KI_02610 [Opitutales bacterium ASA1]